MTLPGACRPRAQAKSDVPIALEVPPLPQASAQELPRRGAFGGPETCFNALDDNGNGLIDEGCGVAQSEIQFVVAWEAVDADLDLYVRDPEGELAVTDGTTQMGLTLSADCPRQKKLCHGQNYENAYVEQSAAAPGSYSIRLRLESMPSKSEAIEAVLGVRIRGETSAYSVRLFDEGQEVLMVFDVANLDPEEDRKSEE